MPAMALIITSVFLGSLAQVLLKIGVLNHGSIDYNITQFASLALNPYIWAGLISFGVSFFLWLKILTLVPLSYAYPMVSLGYVFVFLVSWLYLGENPAPLRIIGLIFIITGILFIARS